jgi:hypothetical protein
MTTRKKTTSPTTARGATAMHGHAGAKQGTGQGKKSPAKDVSGKSAVKSPSKRQDDEDAEESPNTASKRNADDRAYPAHGARTADHDSDERTRGTLKGNLDRDPASRHREAVTGTEAEEDGVSEETLDDASESDVEQNVEEDDDTAETEEKTDEKRRS